MKNKKILAGLSLCMLCLILISSCNYTKNVFLLSRGSVDQKNFIDSVDFEYRHGLVVVKGVINDKDDTLDFIFDTGAFDNKITQSWTDEYGLPVNATKDKSDSRGNENKIEMTLLDKVSIGNIDFKNSAAGIIDYPENSLSPCIAADGIIGANLIREANWKIDFVNQKILITDNFKNFSEVIEKDLQPIKFKKPLLSGTPTVDVKINNRELGNILIDIGSNGGVDLPLSILDKVDNESNRDTTIDNSSSGIWGTRYDTLITINSDLSLGNNELSNLPVDFSTHGFAKIGTELLSKYDVYFNYDKKRIYLSPNSTYSDTERKKDFGFLPYYTENENWIVKRIRLGSPAYKAGIRYGDVIESINGNTPSVYYHTFCGYYDWVSKFLETSNSLSLVIDGKEIQVQK